VKILRDANYEGWLALEYEAAGDPWKDIPRWMVKMREVLGAAK
jgi:hypothetical protein